MSTERRTCIQTDTRTRHFSKPMLPRSYAESDIDMTMVTRAFARATLRALYRVAWHVPFILSPQHPAVRRILEGRRREIEAIARSMAAVYVRRCGRVCGLDARGWRGIGTVSRLRVQG
jgi:hypothetical protein